MPVVRTPISVSQLADLLGVDSSSFVAVERRVNGWVVVTEEPMQTSGTLPQVSDNTIRKKPKGKGKCR